MATEKQIETKLKEMIEGLGGLCYKFVSPGRASVPDRLCVLPKGITYFIECKGVSGKLRAGQQREILLLRNMDHKAYVVDSIDGIRTLKYMIQGDMEKTC